MTRSSLSTVSPAVEAALILSAKSGDEEAMTTLFHMYEPAINAAAYRFTPRLELDDARQACALGFLAAVADFDPERPSGEQRLAVTLGRHLTHALWTAVSDGALIGVPTRMVRRYFDIMRAAGGDLTKAEEIAADHDVRPETFRAAATAMNPGTLTYDSDALEPEAASRFTAIEDQILSRAALDAMPPEQRVVVELRYGIGSESGEEVPMLEVAARLGLSRSKAMRLHADGLAAARAALGVA